MHYILEGHKPVPCDLMTWARWLETNRANKHVADDYIENPPGVTGAVRVSTVFLGLDHGYGGGPPILFETMIFGGPHNEEMWRYSTWEEAEAGHARAVEIAKGA